MKILFAQKLPYLPALSGAGRVGRCLLEGLAERGHECRAIGLVGTPAEELKRSQAPNREGGEALTLLEVATSHQVFVRNKVTVSAFANGTRLHQHLNAQIQEFDPDRIIISEDPTYMLLAAATEIDPRRTVFLSQSQAPCPSGRKCSNPTV